ncbi:hypothetical protein BSKO_11804 [Bryopsis sp. KO-2023]|nr:hypothetical protein BSKO_11804 [Bryopsis sp. KO-2023]
MKQLGGFLLVTAIISTWAAPGGGEITPPQPSDIKEISNARPRCEFLVFGVDLDANPPPDDPTIHATVSCDGQEIVDVEGALSTMQQKEVAKGITLFPSDGRSYLWVDDARMFDLVDSHFDNLPGNASMLAPVIVGKTRMGMNGTVFSGNSGFRKAGAIYCTDGCDIIAENSVFLKCQGTDAGAVVVDNDSELEVENIHFTENSGTVNAGAISVHDKSKLEVEGCRFSGVEAPEAFLQYVRGDSDFIPNEVEIPNAGAIAMLDSSFASIKGSDFLNHAGMHGTVYASGHIVVTISSCKFIKNFVAFGGGVFIQGVAGKIKGSTFDNNNARMGGGVVILGSGRYSLFGCVFFMNMASESGGAIYSDFTFPNGTQCEKATEGHTILIDETRFVSNTAAISGGGIFSKCTQISANTTVFDGNEAKKYGGGIYMDFGVELDAKRSTFNANLAGMRGSAIHTVNTTTLDANDCVFTGNTVHGVGGGAISTKATQDVKLSDCEIVGNSVMGSGGGLSVEEAENILIAGCQLKKNSAGPKGGAMWVDGVSKQISIQDAEVMENSAEVGGGLVLENIKEGILDSVKFSSNKAVSKGGALVLRVASDFETKDVDFEGNTATYSSCGGALVDGVESIRSKKTRFVSNKAQKGNGGAICLRGKTTKWSSDSTVVFSSNSCGLFGGAMSVEGLKMVSFDGTRFEKNGGQSGGAIHAKSVEKILGNGLVVSENEAKGDGGGIMYDGVEIVELIDAKIVENSSGGEGGGALMVGGVDVEFTRAQISRNEARSGGGGLVLRSCNLVEVDASDFHNNTSGRSGGAILVENLDDFRMSDTEISRNSAHDDGGAIHLFGGTLVNVTNVSLVKNSADGSGGAVLCGGDSSMTVIDTTFDFNYARSGQSIAAECTCVVDIFGSLFKRDKKRRRNGDFFAREKSCSSILRDVATVFIGAPSDRLSGWWIAFIVVMCVLVLVLCCCGCYRRGFFRKWGLVPVSHQPEPVPPSASPLLENPDNENDDDDVTSYPISISGALSSEIQAAPKPPPGSSGNRKKPATHEHFDEENDGDFYCDICGEYVNEDDDEYYYDDSYDYEERCNRAYRNGKGPRRAMNRRNHST